MTSRTSLPVLMRARRMEEDLKKFARETRSMMAARHSAFDDIAAAEANEHGQRPPCPVVLAPAAPRALTRIRLSGSSSTLQSLASSPVAHRHTPPLQASTALCCQWTLALSSCTALPFTLFTSKMATRRGRICRMAPSTRASSILLGCCRSPSAGRA